MFTSSLLLALLTSSAHAAPNTLSHQGRLVDTAGGGVNGTVQLEFTLHTSATGENPVWSEQDTAVLADGYFATILGDSSSLAGVDFASETLWLEVGIVGDTPMAPRTELSAVPAALSLAGGFRPPNVTTVERNALAAQLGQLVFNTDTNEIQVFDSGGWTRLGGTAPSGGEAEVLVWGRNALGQLGLDNTTNVPAARTSPSMPPDVVSISGGVYRHSSHTALQVITASGQLYGSGYGNHLPDASRSSVDVFTEYPVASPFVKLFGAKGGLHTCGIDAAGLGYCYGYRQYGVLGGGLGNSTTYNMVPVLVDGDPTNITPPLTWKVLAPAGYYDGSNHDGHTCGVTTQTGQANGYCWGRNTSGTLGNGSTAHNYIGPGPDTLLDEPADGWPNGIEWADIDAGYYQSCGVDINGGGWCWGDAATGRLGTGNTTDRLSPTAITGGHVWQDIEIGEDHACGLRVDGAILCWGDNAESQLGTGTTVDELNPVEILGSKTWKTLSVGRWTSCAIDTSDQLFCWGDNSNGEIGDGLTTDVKIPTQVYGDYRFSDVVVAGRSVIATTR